MIDVTNILKVYEEEGKDAPTSNAPNIKLLSHWNRQEFLVLELPNGKKYTVVAKDLQNALANATNTSRY